MWEPIETAPKDGSVCIICIHEWGCKEKPLISMVARFRDGDWREELNDDHIDDSSYTHPPTHWMPLPAPPVKESLTTEQLTKTSENVSNADLTNAADTSQNIEHMEG